MNGTLPSGAFLPLFVGENQKTLSIKLSTGSDVDNICFPGSHVRVSVMVGFVENSLQRPPPYYVLDFDFNSRNGTFPFSSSSIITKALRSHDRLEFVPMIADISIIESKGDFDSSSSEYFVAEFIGGASGAIVDSRNSPPALQCANVSMAASIAPPISLDQQEFLEVQLTTSSQVNDECNDPFSFVRFSVTIQYFQRTEAPSMVPSELPSMSAAPTQSPRPTTSPAPTYICGLLPPVFVLDFHFNSFDGSFPFGGATHTITKPIVSYDESCYKAVVLGVSEMEIYGDFDGSSESFVVEFVLEKKNVTIIDTSQMSAGQCVDETLSPSVATPVFLDSKQLFLQVKLSTTSNVNNFLCSPTSFVRFNVSVGFLEETEAPSMVPSEPPTRSAAPTQIARLTTSPAPTNICGPLPPLVVLDFHFNSVDGSFPSIGATHTITKPIASYDESCYKAAVVGVSDMEIYGDFDHITESFVAEFVLEQKNVTIIDTSQMSTGQCVNETLSPSVATPVFLDSKQFFLQVKLSTTSNVNDFCSPASFVRFNVTIQLYSQRTETPSMVPSELPSRSAAPTQSPHPTTSLAPTYTCAPLPPVFVLDFHFNSFDGSFPFGGATHTITKPIVSYDESCYKAVVVGVSDMEIYGDFDHSTESFVAEFVLEEKNVTIIDTSQMSTGQCFDETLSPSVATPVFLDSKQLFLQVKLSTTSNVNDFVCSPASFVRFNVTIQYSQRTEAPSVVPSELPTRSVAPTQSPHPTTSLSPTYTCGRLPPVFVLDFHFNSFDGSFPFGGATHSITKPIVNYDERCYKAVVWSVSDMEIYGDFDLSTESFVAEFVLEKKNVTIIDTSQMSTGQCVDETLSPSVATPVCLDSKQLFLQVKLSSTSNVNDFVCSPTSFVRFNVSVGFVEETEAPSMVPSELPTRSAAPTQTARPTTSPAPTYICGPLPPGFVLDFHFNSFDGSFPFVGATHTITEPIVSYDASCFKAVVVGVSDMEIYGDFDLSTESFVAEFVLEEKNVTIIDTSQMSTSQCFDETLSPSVATPVFLDSKQLFLQVKLSTTSHVNDFVCSPASFVRFNVSVGFVEETYSPSLTPSPLFPSPNRRLGPSQSTMVRLQDMPVFNPRQSLSSSSALRGSRHRPKK